MTQITLNIPDNEMDFFLKLMKKFNYSVSENDFELSNEQIYILNKSSLISNDDCISINQLQIRMNDKYAI